MQQFSFQNSVAAVVKRRGGERWVDLGTDLYRHGYLDAFRSVGGTFLLALDGTDCFASERLSCASCSHQTSKKGKTLHRHIGVTPALAAPAQEKVLPLPPPFVEPEDGSDKQDCELAAAKCWHTW